MFPYASNYKSNNLKRSTLFIMNLRCKDTLFFRNFQEINKKVLLSGGGEGEKQKSATPMGALHFNIKEMII